MDSIESLISIDLESQCQENYYLALSLISDALYISNRKGNNSLATLVYNVYSIVHRIINESFDIDTRLVKVMMELQDEIFCMIEVNKVGDVESMNVLNNLIEAMGIVISDIDNEATIIEPMNEECSSLVGDIHNSISSIRCM